MHQLTIVRKIPNSGFISTLSPSVKIKFFRRSFLQVSTMAICWAATESTGRSIRLNSSKHPQEPDWARPKDRKKYKKWNSSSGMHKAKHEHSDEMTTHWFLILISHIISYKYCLCMGNELWIIAYRLHMYYHYGYITRICFHLICNNKVTFVFIMCIEHTCVWHLWIFCPSLWSPSGQSSWIPPHICPGSGPCPWWFPSFLFLLARLVLHPCSFPELELKLCSI